MLKLGPESRPLYYHRNRNVDYQLDREDTVIGCPVVKVVGSRLVVAPVRRFRIRGVVHTRH